MRHIYVASSWRNERQPAVVTALRDCGHTVYDFRHPNGEGDGFHWSEIEPGWQSWTPRQFRQGLEHPIAVRGFRTDREALNLCNVIVLVMPCGRSAHLEFGYAVGRGAKGFILLSDGELELMYRFADDLCLDLPELLEKLREAPAKKE